MAHREILWFPHEALRWKCDEVKNFDQELASLLDDMSESMYSANGVGLAAPQIGIKKRVIVIDVDDHRGISQLELINPKIITTSEEIKSYEEGCLSFPGLYAPVTRPANVRIQAQDREGQLFEMDAEGLLSIAIQHEIDHLNGVLFIDHVSRLRRGLIVQKMKKMNKQRAKKGK